MARRPRIDRELAKYLVEGERVIVAVRRHWFALAREILLVVAGTALAIWADVSTPLGAGGELLRSASLLLFWGALGWLLWQVLNWRHEWFVATDKRFLLFYGFIRRRVAMMPLLKVTDMTFDRSPLGRVIGYGAFVLESAGQEQALSEISFVPDADEHYRAICTQLFGPGSQIRFPPGYGPPSGWGGDAGPGGPGDPGGWGGDPGPGRDRPGGGRGGPATADGRGSDGQVPRSADGHAPAVLHGPGDGRFRARGPERRARPGPEPESWYRSSTLDGPVRRGDTGEIPVVLGHEDRVPGESDAVQIPVRPPGRHRPGGRAQRAPRPAETPLYPPPDWLD